MSNTLSMGKRKIRWQLDVPAANVEVLPIVPVSTPDTPSCIRQGNGHRPAKIRNMTSGEKTTIRSIFLRINGIAENDFWVEVHHGMDAVIAIFQVTGYVSFLHRKVASGTLRLNDLNSYVEHMKTKRNLWATYNSPKYRALRAQLESRLEIQSGTNSTTQVISPKFSGMSIRKVSSWY